MLSKNQQLRRDFDDLWKQKIENSKYNLEESTLESFSARQCRVWDTLVFYYTKKVKPKLVFWEKIKTELETIRVKLIWKVVKKPEYRDEFFKMRPGNWYVILQEESWDYFYAWVENVFAKIK